MRKYEVMYVIRTDIDDEAVQAVAEKFKNVIASGNGEITKHEMMGKKRLAYEINKHRDGHYVLVQFTSDSQVVVELDRLLKISDEVLRFIITRDAA